MALNILLAGVVGSQAYGLASPDSDVDRLGIYAAPTIQFHGLRPPLDRRATIVTNNPDVTMHEAGKFANLVLKGNPTVTELLWLNAYDTQTDLGAEAIGIRRAFLCAKAVRDSYFGYATSQFKLLLNTGQFQSKMRARSAKHGRHLLRLLHQGYELYSTGKLTIQVHDPQWYIDQGNLIADDPENARAHLVFAEKCFDAATSPLPERPDEERVEKWLHAVRDHYYPPRVAVL